MPIIRTIKNEVGPEVRQRLQDISDIHSLSVQSDALSKEASERSIAAKTEAESTQLQLNEVAKGATNAETAQARVDEDNAVYETLKSRLDTKDLNFKADLGNLDEFITQVDEAVGIKFSNFYRDFSETDDTGRLQRYFQYVETKRNDSDDRGVVRAVIDKQELVVSSYILINRLDRLHIKGHGSSVTVIKLADGVTLPVEDDSGKYGIIKTTRERAMNWSIRGITFRGNGMDGSSNNNGLVIYNAQQNGIIDDVVVADFGGHCLYLGNGSGADSNLETSLFHVNDSWFFNAGDTIVKCMSKSGLFTNVHAERSLRGNGIEAEGATFIECHTEHTIYGIDTTGDKVYASTIIGCTGYAADAVAKGYAQPVAFIRGVMVDIEACSSDFYVNFAELNGMLHPEDPNYHTARNISLNFGIKSLMDRVFLGDAPVQYGVGAAAAPLHVIIDMATRKELMRLGSLDKKMSLEFDENLTQSGFGGGAWFTFRPDKLGSDIQIGIAYGGNSTYKFGKNKFETRIPQKIGINNGFSSFLQLGEQYVYLDGFGRVRVKTSSGDPTSDASGQIAAAPTKTSISAPPEFIGDTAVVNGVGYLGVGVTYLSDWKQITN
jgi:hypothetical protein